MRGAFQKGRRWGWSAPDAATDLHQLAEVVGPLGDVEQGAHGVVVPAAEMVQLRLHCRGCRGVYSAASGATAATAGQGSFLRVSGQDYFITLRPVA